MTLGFALQERVHDLDMRSKVHPKYKTKYRVGNWSAYEQALVQRGDVTLWLSAALLHESSRAHTMPPDRILTCRCDMTRVGRGRSSDSGSHSRGRPHSPAQLDSGREDQLR